MASQKELLQMLNDTRKLNGKKPLKSCKESKKKIQEWIDKEQALFDKNHEPPEHIEDQTSFTVADLARDYNVSPKTARRRLRQAKDVPPTLKDDNTWEFDIIHRQRILAIIHK